MSDVDLIRLISEKIGHEYEETPHIISKKIGYLVNQNNHVIQLCINDCNLMNETIPNEIWQLRNLQILCLSNNMISVFPEGLLELHNLISLNISGNQLRVITEKIEKMQSLQLLDLAGNQLETLPINIGRMTSLKKIRLNTNRLISLPCLDPNIAWQQLESIDLDGADMRELPSWLFSLKSLRFLSLSKLHLNRFPGEFCNLLNLEQLYIDSTEFPTWPREIYLPGKMHFIVLDGAHLPVLSQIGIYRIPDAIINLKPKYVRNQKSIDKDDLVFQVSLGGNICVGLDENQLFHDNPQISYNYLTNLYNLLDDQTHEAAKYSRLKDIKVVLLGAGAVGKTSLIQRLQLSNPDNDNIALESVQTTHGVNVDFQLNINNIWDDVNKTYDTFTAHFWDFGGQEKYSGINRLLLTDKAIYIVVIDSRSQTKPDVWLEMIKSFSPCSRIILVANKIDENPRLNINFNHYCDRYPQLYNCLFKISCKYPSLGINRIADIASAIKKIIEEQMNIIAPIGRAEWLEIKSEIDKQYRVHGKVILSAEEYGAICNSCNITDKNAQMYLLSVLSNCGSCIAIEGEEVSILSPDWIADFLYLFYEITDNNKAVLDYKKEYIPLLKQLNKYTKYQELITDYLEQRGLCAVFLDSTRIKKIFIPMFLPEQCPDIVKIPRNSPLLTYIFQTDIIPEYEYHKFLVNEFSSMSGHSWHAWRFGVFFRYNNSEINLQLVSDGITLKIWSEDLVSCGRCFQKIRSAILNTANNNFFHEYIILENNNRKALLPYMTLEILNSWNFTFYCLPEQENMGTLIPIDITMLTKICGLKISSYCDEYTDVLLRYKMMCEYGGDRMNINIKNMYGDIKKIETHGTQSPVYINDDVNESALMQAISNLNNLIDLINSNENYYGELKLLLSELEDNTSKKNRISIKKRISNWVSQVANIVTVGGAFKIDGAVQEGIKNLLSLIK